MEQFLEAVLSQTPSIALLGYGVYWLGKRYEKERDKNEDISKKFIEITFMWEKKLSDDSESLKEVKNLLQRLIDKDLERNGNHKAN